MRFVIVVDDEVAGREAFSLFPRLSGDIPRGNGALFWKKTLFFTTTDLGGARFLVLKHEAEEFSFCLKVPGEEL